MDRAEPVTWVEINVQPALNWGIELGNGDEMRYHVAQFVEILA